MSIGLSTASGAYEGVPNKVADDSEGLGAEVTEVISREEQLEVRARFLGGSLEGVSSSESESITMTVLGTALVGAVRRLRLGAFLPKKSCRVVD